MAKSIAVFPGSFDPFHLGHLDIVKRSLNIVDQLVIAIGSSSHKSGMYSSEQRLSFIKLSTQNLKNIDVVCFEGLLVDYMKENNLIKVIRGIRSSLDYEYEMRMAHTNKALYPDVETIFLSTDPKLSHISSSLVRQIIGMNGPIKNFLPIEVHKKILSL